MSRESSELDDELPPLEHGDAMSLTDNDARHVYTPPPRIAARLSAGNRRRSSAASSRRNSLSSTKSSASSVRTAFRAGQNTHVAQHLRRASIIDTRKARLAQRAAHVEEVRLRAALSKAERISTTQERTLAAQQARENHLAKVAEKCAEEVNHAKRVAEETKERKAAEEQRVRLQMQEKHAEAERRALEFKRSSRKPRATSIPSTSSKKSIDSLDSLLKIELSVEVASVRIQRAWKQRKRRFLVKEFVDLDLSIDRVRNMDFMAASALLADTKVIASASRILIFYGLNVDERDDKTFVRRFLSAYMILGHPTDIFTKQGQQEQNLIEMAKELLISFEAAIAHSSTTRNASAPATALETLSQAHASYLSAFAAWRTRDASVLIGTMVDQFVALDSIWQTVKDDTRGEVANDYREGIRNQQVILLSKIKKLAGPEEGNLLIKNAIRESRRTRTRQRPKGDSRPRPIAGPEAGSSGPNSATAAQTFNNDDGATQQTQESLEIGELSRIFSVVPPNRVLVHELQLDPTFKIEVSPHSDVRNALNREVCDRMRTAVHEGNGDIWTLAVAENISKRLLKLLKPGNSMHRLLSEVLDIDHIRRQCEQGVFSYDKFFGFMADLLPRLCAPIRDQEVQALATVLKTEGDEVDTMIEKLFGLLHTIDIMSLDYTNYMVQQAAPTLVREAEGYEQRMFAQDIESGAVTLDRTKRWWRHATVSILTDQGAHQDPSSVDFRRIYARGLVDLAIGLGPLRAEDVPETLTLDVNRFVTIRTEILRITAVGAILLTAKNLLKRDVRSQWKPEAKRIMDSIKAASNFDNSDGNLSMRIGAIVETSHAMPQSSREQLASVIKRFLAECRAARLSDPVLKLLFQRLKMHVFARVAAVTSQERVRVASTASEGLAGIGLSEFIGQVGDVSTLLGKVTEVDMKAHRTWYRQVEDELARMGEVEA
ncbi:hypothetical protein FH972_026325 [Carpinus fangiana]|uniref:Uncharacterized protein n=1 Tax=Carpinus fangiana TaxID=176857 RepID=A0A5N6L3P4_9ROSI|nr:hypothetical protein FH972_026325 [Carpinus fangiana]